MRAYSRSASLTLGLAPRVTERIVHVGRRWSLANLLQGPSKYTEL